KWRRTLEPAAHEGGLSAGCFRFALVSSRWNDFLTGRLVEGALDALERLGADSGAVEHFRVPGSFEIPLLALKLAQSGRFDAVVCLGTIIRGQTPHFEYVAGEVTKGIAHAALSTGVPVLYGVVTADTLEQAIDRAGVKAGNKGFEAAMSAVEMVNLYKMVTGDKCFHHMGSRRKARECALQMLFAGDIAGAERADELVRAYWEELGEPEMDEGARELATRLVTGALAHIEEIDERIRSRAEHWRISRMAVVDRNILRMAVYEFLHEPTPRTVAINEALEIARRFSTYEATQFINGILDAIKRDLDKESPQENVVKHPDEESGGEGDARQPGG